MKDEKSYCCSLLASSNDQLTNKDSFRCCVSNNLLTGVILFNNQCKCLKRDSISSAWLLLSNYNDINSQREDFDSNTALMELIKTGDTELIDFLLINEADTSVTNDCGEYPLHVAAAYGYLDIARKLQVSGKCDLADNNAQTPLHNAAEAGHLDVVRWLLSSRTIHHLPDDVGQMPLHKAAINDHAAVVEALVEWGSDLDMIDHEHMTPLHLAALNRCEKVLKLLLEWGADIHAINSTGDTPLHLVFSDNKPVSLLSIAYLLYYNADPLTYNDDNQCPAYLATEAIEKALLEIPIEPIYEGQRSCPPTLEETCKNVVWCTILDLFCRSEKAAQEQFFTAILPYFIIDSTPTFSSGRILRGFSRDLPLSSNN
ncbi:ankyrin repeat domain-containing protein [Kistimonas asteriae]|uniref:ankyrin repeat domain-containing protein n=1 Tax=Kistimonas asteriae TaxID=517724 RepID=UPI001BAB51B7|nr:ankyrin repeat domain-containing protein [Kistimonas asteriae]